MNIDHSKNEGTNSTQDFDKTESKWVQGDDERENREHIAKTGEPKRDALGNGEGSS